jgi:hypothetical protein
MVNLDGIHSLLSPPVLVFCDSERGFNGPTAEKRDKKLISPSFLCRYARRTGISRTHRTSW